jgi:hypothetical protein
MGNTPQEKRHKPLGEQWKLLDIVMFTIMAALVILFMLIFTSLGDSLAAAGQRHLDAATRADDTSAGESCLKLTVCIVFHAHAECVRVGEHMHTCFGESCVNL